MEKLRTHVPQIKGENLRIIVLFFAGYSYETVQLLLNKVSVESLKTARSRFRKEILHANSPDGAFFLDMLEVKRRPQTGTNESGENEMYNLFLKSWNGRPGKPEEMAYPLVIVGSDIAAYLSGQVIYIDFGMTGEMDWLAAKTADSI